MLTYGGKTLVNKGFLARWPEHISTTKSTLRYDQNFSIFFVVGLDKGCYHVVGFRHVEITKERWQVPHGVLLWLLPYRHKQAHGKAYHEAQGKQGVAE